MVGRSGAVLVPQPQARTTNMTAEVYVVGGSKGVRDSMDKIKKSKLKISRRRDLKREPLSWAEVKSLAKLSGGADKIFNDGGFENNASLKNGPFSENQMLKLMAKDNVFIKSLILLLENRKVVSKIDTKALSRIAR